MNAVVGVLLWLPALPLIAEDVPWAGLPLVLAGVVVAWRGFRLRVSCASGKVTVHGYLRNWTIDCADVVRLERDVLPAIGWQDSTGRTRYTRLQALRPNPRWPVFDARHAANQRRLGRYIAAHKRRRRR